jgi:hypothetical protein
METATIETFVKPITERIVISRQSKPTVNPLVMKYNQLVESLKPNYYSVISMAILIGSCMGSIAAMSVFYNHADIGYLCVALFTTMANLVACIGQAPVKWVLNFFTLSVVANLVLILLFPVI